MRTIARLLTLEVSLKKSHRARVERTTGASGYAVDEEEDNDVKDVEEVKEVDSVGV